MKSCQTTCSVVGVQEGTAVRVIQVDLLWLMDFLLELCHGVKAVHVQGTLESIPVLRSYENGSFTTVVYNILLIVSLSMILSLNTLFLVYFYTHMYRVAHEKPARCLVDLRPHCSTRWRAGFSRTILYFRF